MVLKKQHSDSYSQALLIFKSDIDYCFSQSLNLIREIRRTTKHTKTLIDHRKIIQSDLIEMGLSDHELIYGS